MASHECNNVSYSLPFRLSILLYIVITVLSLAGQYASILLGGIVVRTLAYIPVLIILFRIINNAVLIKQVKFRIYILWLIPFLFIYFICFEVLASKSLHVKEIIGIKINIAALQMLHIIPALVISWYILQMKDKHFNNILTSIVICLFAVDFVLTLIALRDNPLAARALAAGIPDLGEEYLLKGVSGFDICYSAVLLVPCIMFLISRFNRLKRLCLLVFLALTIIYVYMSGYVIAILVLFTGICLYLFLSTTGATRMLLAIPVLILTITIIDKSFINYVLNFLIDNIGVEQVQVRIRAFSDLIMYGDTSSDALGRISLYKQSLGGFTSSPIFGIFLLDSKYRLSEHSTMLDLLAGCGLVGFIPLCIFIYCSYKYSVMYVKDDMYNKCILSTYVIFLFIATLNPQLASPNVLLTLFVFNPIICSITDTA
jgi:hypothetical protein